MNGSNGRNGMNGTNGSEDGTGDGDAGERLHDWRQAALVTALEEQCGAAPPAELAARTLQRLQLQGAPLGSVAGRRRSQFAAAALLLLGIGTVFAVALTKADAGPAQDPAPQLLPLQPGAEWEYEVRGDGGARTVQCRVLAALQAEGGDGPQVSYQLLVRDAARSSLQFLAVDEHGVHRRSGGRGTSFQGSSGAWTVLLPLPAAKDARWTTQQTDWLPLRAAGGGVVVVAAGGFGGGGGGGARPVALKRDPMPLQGEVVDAAAAVEVPAGKFTAVHVRLQPVDEKLRQDGIAEELWIAPGTGIVKRVLGKPEPETWQLARFTPGKPQPDAAATLREFLRRDAGITNFGPVQATEWLQAPQDLPQLRTRFCVVTFVDRKLGFAVRDGAVAAFVPDDAAAWTALLAAEGMQGWSEGLLPQARVTTLAHAALQLHAALQGITGLQLRSEVRVGPHAQIQLAARGKDAAGNDATVCVTFVVQSDDTVARAEITEPARDAPAQPTGRK